MRREPLYFISVAARIVGMHPQTLRKYERCGLVEPPRTVGKVRLYSDEDLERLRQIKYLVDEVGVNIAGLDLIMQATEHLHRIEAVVAASELPEARRRDLLRELAAIHSAFGRDSHGAAD
ncbi:MAG: MerR family transcriptional regulator [Chloroflexi bacterium]|nr:MerR family transcriptional regulator [Chloroflexota bacterium]